MSIPIAITWVYSSTDRYDSDLHERLGGLVKDLCEAVPAKHDGSGGGCFMGGGDGFNADNSEYFMVPNWECAERLQEFIDMFLKGYDERYVAVLNRLDEGGD